MKKIALSGKNGKGKFAIVDDEDYEILMSKKWYLTGIKLSSYAATIIKNKKGRWAKTIYMHKLIIDSKEKQIDHINGNRLDNRKCNLRICTPSQNCMNRAMIKNYSGFKGVHSNSYDTWKATIELNNNKIHIGNFRSKEEAAKAYNKKALELFGEFARLNDF